jgi:hypothetical protein
VYEYIDAMKDECTKDGLKINDPKIEMMNYRTTILRGLILITLLFACKKEEIPPEPGFRCKVNGIPWVPKRGDAIFAKTPWDMTYFPPESKTEGWANSLIMWGRDNTDAVSPAFATNISLKGVFTGLGKHEFSDDSTGWARGTVWHDTTDNEYFDLCLGGWIEFDRFEGPWSDQPWYTYARFEYTLVNQFGDTIYITEGEFLDYE